MKFKYAFIAIITAAIFGQGALSNAQCCGRVGLLGRIFGIGQAYQQTYTPTRYYTVATRSCPNGQCPLTANTQCPNGQCPLTTSAGCYEEEVVEPCEPTQTVEPCAPIETVATPAPCYPCETVETSTQPCEPVQTVEPCAPIETVATPPCVPCEEIATSTQPCEPVQTVEPCAPIETTCTTCGQKQTVENVVVVERPRPVAEAINATINAPRKIAQRVAETLEIVKANRIRARYGAGPLTFDAYLTQGAQAHAVNMWNYQRIYHAPGCGWEIVAMNWNGGMDEALNQWQRSRAHFNILTNRSLSRVGVGHVHDRNGRDWCVMRFR